MHSPGAQASTLVRGGALTGAARTRFKSRTGIERLAILQRVSHNSATLLAQGDRFKIVTRPSYYFDNDSQMEGRYIRLEIV